MRHRAADASPGGRFALGSFRYSPEGQMYRRAAPYMEQASSRYRSGSFCTDRYRGGCPWLFSEVADLTKAGSGLGRPNCHKCFDTNTVEYGPSSGTASKIAFLCTGSVNSIKTEST